MKILSALKLLKNLNVGNLSTSFERVIKKVVNNTIIDNGLTITGKICFNKFVAPQTF